MNEPYAPDGYPRVIPYLTVKDAQKLLAYIVVVFNAEVLVKIEHENGVIAHAAVRIGDAVIELAEAIEQYGPMPGAIHIYVPDVDRTHQRAIDQGGQSLHEPMEMDYGERASAVKDLHGNQWYIATYHR